jgi:hypothetical protein
MTSTTPASCARDGVSASRIIDSTTVATGWASRMIDVTTAGSRGSETLISR